MMAGKKSVSATGLTKLSRASARALDRRELDGSKFDELLLIRTLLSRDPTFCSSKHSCSSSSVSRPPTCPRSRCSWPHVTRRPHAGRSSLARPFVYSPPAPVAHRA